MRKKIISVAIIGAGSMAREHIKAFSALPEAKVVGICSRTRERAETLSKELGIEYVADSMSELYRKTKADLLVIAVPELMANAVAKEAFCFPWAVLMEKPAGYDLTDAEDIAAAAYGRTSPVMVGFNRRFYSSTRAVQADLASRSAERRFIHVQDQQSYAEARKFNHPQPVVEKFMYANSIHLIDMILAFGRGKIKKVDRITPWQGEKTEVMLAYIEFDSGDSGIYEGIWQGPGPWACAVSTLGRRWTLQPLEQATYQNSGERVRNTLEISEDDRNLKPGFLLQARAAVGRALGKTTEIVSLEDSLATMRLIHRIFGV